MQAIRKYVHPRKHFFHWLFLDSMEPTRVINTVESMAERSYITLAMQVQFLADSAVLS